MRNLPENRRPEPETRRGRLLPVVLFLFFAGWGGYRCWQAGMPFFDDGALLENILAIHDAVRADRFPQAFELTVFPPGYTGRPVLRLLGALCSFLPAPGVDPAMRTFLLPYLSFLVCLALAVRIGAAWSPRAAILALLATGLSPNLQAYSNNLMAMSPALAFELGAFLCLLGWLRTGAAGKLLAAGLLWGLGVFVYQALAFHAVAAVIVLAAGRWLLPADAPRFSLRQFLRFGAVAVLPYLLFEGATTVYLAIVEGQWPAAPFLARMYEQSDINQGEYAWGWYGFITYIVGTESALLYPALLALLGWRRRTPWPLPVRFFAAYFVVSYLVAIAIGPGWGKIVIYGRYVYFFVPVLLLILAILAAESWSRRWVRLGAVVFLGLQFLACLNLPAEYGFPVRRLLGAIATLKAGERIEFISDLGQPLVLVPYGSRAYALRRSAVARTLLATGGLRGTILLSDADADLAELLRHRGRELYRQENDPDRSDPRYHVTIVPPAPPTVHRLYQLVVLP